jgi:alginate O-acetyltransferase complex protein AlgI
MLFNSPQFIFFFLPVTFIVYTLLDRRGLGFAARLWLVASSIFFYGWWNIAYLPLLVGSVLVNFGIGTQLNSATTRHKHAYRKALLAAGIAANLALLAYFKYADFLIGNLNTLVDSDYSLPKIVLPLAISFFTFQQIAYLVDNYHTEAREQSFVNYALFISFFPQLIAGPIVHHKEMMPQFGFRPGMQQRYRNISLGLFIFSIGLFKKAILADTFAQWATLGFDEKSTLGFLEAWITSFSYTFQLYFDFSGYTDMAIGAALLFNIKLPINFNSPYKALTIQDFWRRWHITLSRFLRDYLYIPLGGNRYSQWRTCINLMITFILGGLWHGAGWMFVCWGALHGAALVIHRLWQKLGYKLPTVLGWALTFNFVNFAWIFFRAKDMGDALKVIQAMLSVSPGPIVGQLFQLRDALLQARPLDLLIPAKIILAPASITWLVAGLVIVLLFRNSCEREYGETHVRALAPIGYAFVACAAAAATLMTTYSEFIYFNF